MMRSPKRQQGLTFIELSLTLVLVGLIASLLAELTPAIKRLAVTKTALYDDAQAHDAIVGFALTTSRLPCADTDNDGFENCPAITGGFPYLTLGLGAPLRNLDGNDYHYGVYFRPIVALPQDAGLTELKDRWNPTLAAGLPPTAALTVLSNNNQLDLCKGLSMGLTNNVDNQALYITRLASNEAIAYVLVNPGSADLSGNGSLFDGVNTTGFGFEHPSRPADNQYDDSVSVGYFTTLWERMGCSGLLSAAGHAHPNTLSTLAMFRQTMRDYEAQLKLTEEMAWADVTQQIASVLEATAGLATAGATVATTLASTINSAGATAGASVAAGIAVGLNTASLAQAVAMQVIVVENHNNMVALVAEVATLKAELDALHSTVQTHVTQADSRALSNQ